MDEITIISQPQGGPASLDFSALGDSFTAKVDNSSYTSKENDEEVKQSLREEKEERTLHAILREETLED